MEAKQTTTGTGAGGGWLLLTLALRIFLGALLMTAPLALADNGGNGEPPPGDTCGNEDDDDDEDDCEGDECEDEDIDCEADPEHECCECGDDEEDDDDDDGDGGESPECGEEEGGENRFRAYSGNVRRSIRDLALADGVGHEKLVFRRVTNSRWFGGIPSPFGEGGNWRHSWYWHITEQRDSNNVQILKHGGPVLA